MPGHGCCPSERPWAALAVCGAQPQHWLCFCGGGTTFVPGFGRESQLYRNLKILFPLLFVTFYLANVLKDGH